MNKESKKEKKLAKLERKKNKFKKFKTWYKNMGNSVDALWDVCAQEIPTLALASKLRPQSKKKLLSLSKIEKLSMKEIVELKSIIVDELGWDKGLEGAQALGKEVVHRVSTGKLLENRNRRETGRRNKDSKELQELAARLAELGLDEEDLDDFASDYDTFEESYKGGKMIKDTLELNQMRLRQTAFSEDFVNNNSYKNATKYVNELVDKVLDTVPGCTYLLKDEVNDLIIQERLRPLKESINELASTLGTDPTADSLFNPRLATAMAVVLETEASYELTNLNEDTIDEAIKKLDEGMEHSTNVSPTFGKTLNDNLEGTVEDLEDIKEDLVFSPYIDEEIMSNKVPVGERRTFKEDFDITGIGGLVNTVMMIPALLTNGAIAGRNQVFANKYGTKTNITQPMITTKSMSSTTARLVSKALEIKYALQLKTLLESTVSAMDGGSVNSRIRQANILSPGRIDVKDVKLYSDNKMSYDEIISVFSEGYINTDFLGFFSSDMLYAIPSGIKQFKESNDLNFIYMKESLYPVGESGIEVDDKRAALPTYLTVSIKYDTPKAMTSFDRTHASNDTIIGVEINPRVITQEDLVNTIKKNKFEGIKVQKDERDFIQRFKDILKYWKKKPNSPQAKVLDSKSFAYMATKISNIKTPLFHIAIEYADYLELKQNGVDLFNRDTYKKVMMGLPIISITVVNEDSGIIWTSDGMDMAFIKHNFDDFIDATSQLEKELRADIKFRHNL